jgi:hypothetical protein
MNSTALITRVVDSASSELRDAFLIQEEDIESIFCDAMDHISRHDDSPPANECPSPVPKKSGAYTAKRVHPLHLL